MTFKLPQTARHIRFRWAALLLAATTLSGGLFSPAFAQQVQPQDQAPLQLPPLPPDMAGQALESQAPLSAPQISAIARQLEEDQEAAHPGPPPLMKSPEINASFQPNGAVYAISMAPGFVSSIAFIGEDGSPWPVTSMTVGNSEWFAASVPSQLNKGAATNVITVGAKTYSASSSLSVLLEGAAEPITIVLLTNPRETDGTVTVRINRPSPESKAPLLEPSLPAPITSALYSFLNGVPPSGAQVLKLSVGGIAAWSYQGSYYVMTSDQMMSPAWTNSANAPDGTTVYQVPQVPVFLVSIDGVPRTVQIKGS
jgi:intracellular multiplication protein IcmK